MRQVLTQAAPAPSGGYSQGMVVAGLVFVSGQGPFDPSTGAVRGTTIEEQTEQTLTNLEAVLGAAGARLADVVKVGVHLADIGLFTRFNDTYASRFADPKPARTTVGSQLDGILVEIDAIAVPRGVEGGFDD
jgi:2-iminobutanoate/2-iminopropanoate deaminase